VCVSAFVWYGVRYCLQCIKNVDYLKYFFKMFVKRFHMRIVLFSGECEAQVRSAFHALSFCMNRLPIKMK
jgi:hypothetical protein